MHYLLCIIHPSISLPSISISFDCIWSQSHYRLTTQGHIHVQFMVSLVWFLAYPG